MTELRPYQKTCVEKMLWGLQLPGNGLIVVPTGGGKTHIISEFTNRHGKPVLILVPSKELLEQDYEKLAAVVDPKEIGIYSASMNSKEVRKYTLATIQSAYKHPEQFAHYEVVLIDECFVAGTKIGNKNIENIKVGDLVDSFNHKTGKIEKKKVLATSKKELQQNLYLTDLTDSSIISTGNHPVYVVNKGYTPVEKLKKGDFIYAKQTQSNPPTAMHRMWATRCFKKLPSVLAIQKDWECLPQKMFFLSERRYHFVYKKGTKNYLFRSTAKKYVYHPETYWTQTAFSGWEWETDSKTATKITGLSWKQLENRICNQNTLEERKFTSPTNFSEDRYRPSSEKNSNRNRRWLTQFCREEIARREKREILVAKGVESVTVYQPRNKQTDGENSNPPTYVYNLEVEDNHNYFANNILAHNCDLMNPKNLKGMYNTFFKAIGNPKVIGLTATPFRLDSYYRRWGRLSWQVETVTTIKFLTRYKERFWDRVLHVVDIDELLENNWLTPLTYHDKTMIPQEKLRFNKSKSEFNLEDFEQKYIPFLDQTANLISNMKEKSVLIFAATINQAEALSEKIPGSVVVTGKTPKKLRNKYIEGFRTNEIRCVINVGVLLVGFDKPNLEAIVIARPTRSLRLHLQLLGRGMRVFPGKETCNIYDLVGNVAEMGKAETFKIEKVANAQGTQLWNITSETKPEGWHYAELYSHKLHKSDPKEEPTKKPRKQSVFSQPGDIREQLKTNWS